MFVGLPLLLPYKNMGTSFGNRVNFAVAGSTAIRHMIHLRMIMKTSEVFLENELIFIICQVKRYSRESKQI